MKMIRLKFILTLILISFLFFVNCNHKYRVTEKVNTPPNILFIFTDDQKWNTIGALGNSYIHTPNLDKLTDNAFVFNNAYCFGGNGAGVCVPSRNMLMTGKNFFRFEEDVRQEEAKTGKKPRPMFVANPQWSNMPKSFNAAGYETFYREKSGSANLPGIRKHFENYADIHQVNALRTGRPAKGIIDDAILFLKDRNQDRPFLMYLGIPAPHDPRWAIKEFRQLYNSDSIPLPASYKPAHPWDIGDMTSRDESLEVWPRSKAAIKKHLYDYYAVISSMDYDIGRLTKELKDSGIDENTIIIFSSDQGLAMGDHGLLGKQNIYEGTMKVPLFFTGKGIPKGSSDALVYLHDIFPTICDLAEIPVPEGLDGESMHEVIQQEKDGVRDYLMLAYRNYQRSIRDERWKLIHYPQINKTQLFDLKNDPEEVTNLFNNSQYSDHSKRLFDLLEKERKQEGDIIDLFPDDIDSSAFNFPKEPLKTPYPAGGIAPEGVSLSNINPLFQ